MSPLVKTSEKELTSFHSVDYIHYIQSLDCNEDEEQEEYGIGYECPKFTGLYSYICSIAGASLAGAKTLVTGEANIAVNWYGGWHHGSKDSAAGFCYCNDVVISILTLLKHFPRILYIDLDIHHGDGVEQAFYYSANVLTISIHKFSPGFFPGTGSLDTIGAGNGQYYCINVPLEDGITDDQYIYLFNSIVDTVYARYCPNVVVVQCGADCLSGDPLGTFNLTSKGMGACINTILKWNLPLMLLGGGGYNYPNTARYWTYLTSLLVNQPLSNDIPEHKYFLTYNPGYQLHSQCSNRKNCNTTQYITELLANIHKNLLKINKL